MKKRIQENGFNRPTAAVYLCIILVCLKNYNVYTQTDKNPRNMGGKQERKFMNQGVFYWIPLIRISLCLCLWVGVPWGGWRRQRNNLRIWNQSLILSCNCLIYKSGFRSMNKDRECYFLKCFWWLTFGFCSFILQNHWLLINGVFILFSTK